MNEKAIIFCRGVYKHLFHPPMEPPAPYCDRNKENIQALIRDKILANKPLMVARFGSIELTSLESSLYERTS